MDGHLIHECLGSPRSSDGSRTLAQVRRKVFIGYNGAPHIRPQNYAFPWTDPQTRLPASSLDPSNLLSHSASISDPPFFHNALDRQTDTHTWNTDQQMVTGKVRRLQAAFALQRATRPNNTWAQSLMHCRNCSCTAVLRLCRHSAYNEHMVRHESEARPIVMWYMLAYI